jgi:hypothetical protein
MVVDVVEDVFRVANELEEELNEGESNGVEQVFFDIKHQQPLGDVF